MDIRHGLIEDDREKDVGSFLASHNSCDKSAAPSIPFVPNRVACGENFSFIYQVDEGSLVFPFFFFKSPFLVSSLSFPLFLVTLFFLLFFPFSFSWLLSASFLLSSVFPTLPKNDIHTVFPIDPPDRVPPSTIVGELGNALVHPTFLILFSSTDLTNSPPF